MPAPRSVNELASIHHDGSARYVTPLDGADIDRLRIGDRVRLRVRAAIEAPVERLFLRTVPDGEQLLEELVEISADSATRWWEVTTDVAMPTTSYRFLVVAAGETGWLNGSGLHVVTPTDRDDFILLVGYEPPTWLRDRVFYQIFPDRFANGDTDNDVRDGAWTYRGNVAHRRDWDERPSPDRSGMVEFFGGDLKGIADHLDHLVALGVNAIYLNPIFASPSNHGYDTSDYTRVADRFGGNAALAALRSATEAVGIRLILDVAPNHVGVEHEWFKEAQADPDSPEAGYFIFREHPHDYESWLGVGSLPKLDYRSAGLRDAMYAGDDAVLRRWLRPPYSIDGWRIDVANMLGRSGAVQLGPEVARSMRTAIKDESPEAYVVGEHWFDAIDQLAGDQWDGVMNYAGFMVPLLHWLDGHEVRSRAGTLLRIERSTTESLVTTLGAYRAAIAWSVARRQYNLIDSHDTGRVQSVLHGDDGPVRAAFGALLTYVGVPSILYGDEIGLDGLDGGDARRTMPWDTTRWDRDRLAFVRRLVRFRVRSAALMDGGFQVLEVGEDHLAYLRDTDAAQVIVLLVRGPGPRPPGPLPVRLGGIPDGAVFTELLSDVTAVVRDGGLDLGPTPPGVVIWVTGEDLLVLHDG